MFSPVNLNAPFNRRRAKDKGTVDEVMQTGRDQNAFEEGVDPDAQRTGNQHEMLHRENTGLHFRPQQQGQPRAGDHQQETNNHHEGAALKNTEEDGKLFIKKMIVY